MWRRLGIARAYWLGPDVTAVAFHTLKKTSELLAFEGLQPRNFYQK